MLISFLLIIRALLPVHDPILLLHVAGEENFSEKVQEDIFKLILFLSEFVTVGLEQVVILLVMFVMLVLKIF